MASIEPSERASPTNRRTRRFPPGFASGAENSHITRQQRSFIDKRNASFGGRGYDLRQAMEERLDKLQTIARQ